jgi:tetratricopeptide (TPR) repeat protein
MKQRKGLAAAGLLLVVAALALGGERLLQGRPAPSRPVAAEGPAAPDRLDSSLALLQKRVAADPYSAQDRAWLASLFLQRARETGSSDDVLRAEEAARRSLELRSAHNSGTYATLALALLEQHRFAEALQAARSVMEADPENASYRALVAEIQLEMGDYRAADVVFGSLESARQNLDVAPRLARWAEISGRPAEARSLLHAARDLAVRRPGLVPEQVAWFHLRVGDFELRHGDLDAAEEALRAGLEVFPEDRRLLAAMARLEGARENWAEAIDFGERAVAAAAEPGTLALLADLYAASGDAERAAEYARVVEVSLAGSAEAYHRAEGLFLLDHGRRVPQVLAQARADLRTRRDVYGHDLLAWALHRSGRHAEARQAMTAALARGTRDPMLLYHAGMIEKALGRPERSREYLRDALDIAPNFHPVHARLAREALACQAPLRLALRVGCD